jgi:hypothetical protein
MGQAATTDPAKFPPVSTGNQIRAFGTSSLVISRQIHGNARRGNRDRPQTDRRLANAAAAEGARLSLTYLTILDNPRFLRQREPGAVHSRGKEAAINLKV